MSKIILVSLLLLFLLGKTTNAQESVIEEINYEQLQEYIRLAKVNYPRKKIFEAQEASAKSQVPMAKLSYLEMFNASYFYRPNNRTVINTVNPFVFNGFQFGASVNLGSFFQKPFQVKQAKQQYKVAKLENEEYEVTLENEVKSRYYDFIKVRNELKIRVQDSQDAKTALSDMQFKYERGEVEFDVYAQARTSMSTAMSVQLASEVAFLKAKDALEEIIGISLTE
ncbi:hypothetical protein GCM10011386_22620 [Parapedobacter defluvii]|uniref:Outer membrane efflux protein n=1 Tax=Parapedobacter defluvii TaxID=2045106 RepID=A0ABQ1LWB2_9SPHI|nr:TolC family protein [Parapedobacter defluvii]GGC30065.1 hypothetical protein GCM10011386_22620 [Parapedobacter defluvii]